MSWRNPLVNNIVMRSSSIIQEMAAVNEEEEETEAFRLTDDQSAWNVDGSSGDKPREGSWIRYWERHTGRPAHGQPCSYVDCAREAREGGHVWIARQGVYIALICKQCNYWENARRMQGGKSMLRRGTVVVRTEYTESMAASDRRIAIDESRCCRDCGEDISDRPENHTQCLFCYMNDNMVEMRACQDCGVDIDDRPENHTQCLNCYRKRGRAKQNQRRKCKDCGEDIGDRPDSHTQCLDCYRNRGRAKQSQRRKCKDCGTDIGDRPESHVQCLDCYRTCRAAPRSRKQQLRQCKDCGDDIHDRPESHTQCLDCYRSGTRNTTTAKRAGRPSSAAVASSTSKRKGTRRSCQSCGDDIGDRPMNHTQCLDCYRSNKRCAW